MLSKTIQLPSNATVNGSCGEKANKSYVSLKFESLTFTWKFEIEKSKSWKSANMSLSGSISGIKGPGRSSFPGIFLTYWFYFKFLSYLHCCIWIV